MILTASAYVFAVVVGDIVRVLPTRLVLEDILIAGTTESRQSVMPGCAGRHHGCTLSHWWKLCWLAGARACQPHKDARYLGGLCDQRPCLYPTLPPVRSQTLR